MFPSHRSDQAKTPELAIMVYCLVGNSRSSKTHVQCTLSCYYEYGIREKILIYRDRQTDRQSNIHTRDRLTNRLKNRQTDRSRHSQTGKQTIEQIMSKQTNFKNDRQTNKPCDREEGLSYYCSQQNAAGLLLSPA